MDKSNDWMQNEHWKVVASGGQTISNTPQQLWEKAVEYFKWCDNNPITAKRTMTSGKTQGDKVEVEYRRPYTVRAMCLHCNISERYINDIKNSHKVDSEWYIIVEKILYIIYTNNLEGALVDLYNPIMVSKVLNLDKGNDGDDDKPVRIEIVNTHSAQMANSESEVLKNLDFQKVDQLKDKLENLER